MTEKTQEPQGQQGVQLQDLRHEAWRVYTASSGAKVQINAPVGIHEGPNGHFVLDAQGIHHLIPQGWVHLAWLPKPQEGVAPNPVGADEDRSQDPGVEADENKED